MARQSDESRSQRGVARVQTVLLVAAAVVLSSLIVLALSQWLERLS